MIEIDSRNPEEKFGISIEITKLPPSVRKEALGGSRGNEHMVYG